MPAGAPTIVDDLLAPAILRTIVTKVESAAFPWEESPILAGDQPGLSDEDNRQLVHGLYAWRQGIEYRSPWLALFAPILSYFEPMRLIKVKLNRTARHPHHVEYGLHLDTRRKGAITAVFYLNTNNGYTLFADGTRVTSQANRLVIFDAALLHTGASCTDGPHRLVLNLNLIPGIAPPRVGHFR